MIAAVCCCFMPGMALAAETAGGEGAASDAAAAAAVPAKGSVSVQTVLQTADAKDPVAIKAAADKKDKSLVAIKVVNGSKEDAKIRVYLWKADKTLTDAGKDNDKKVKASEVSVSGLDKKTGEGTLNNVKVKLTDGKDGRYLEFTVKAGKTADLKIKLEPTEAAKDKTLEAALEVKKVAEAAQAAPAQPAAPAAPAAGNEAVTGTQTAANAAAAETTAMEEPANGSSSDSGTTPAADPVTEDKVEISVTKVWSDQEDKDKIRPANVTIKLFADGTDTEKTLILDADGSWKGSFKDLDKQKDGKDIVYTVEEVAVTDYTAEVTGDVTAGFTVTNTHTPKAEEKVSVSGTITWNDSDNKNKKRPSNVIVRLYANNTEVQNTKVTASNEWKFTFADLNKLDTNGNEITYTIKQDAVTGYTTTYKGFNITNKYKTTAASSTSKKNSTSNRTTSSSRNARTGDETHMALYLVLMLIAAGGAALTIRQRRKN